ncbi:hypothetical protein BLNAU_1176 [Blattamonas nauphoetae]|uniref:Uncharacterized protein n=1 Tax=Blattamonas nauphoetae TaxID=2049346 RepID=A0ABQ9YIM0_9EUKA|nr:hypothetical protein BLNAU_1176 [Blattamonas nauphoetae]
MAPILESPDCEFSYQLSTLSIPYSRLSFLFRVMPALLPSRVTTQSTAAFPLPKVVVEVKMLEKVRTCPNLIRSLSPKDVSLHSHSTSTTLSTAAFPLPKVVVEVKMLEKVPNMPELNQVSFSQGCLLALSLNCHDLVSADEAFVFDCFEFTANCQFIEPVPLVVGLVTGNLARNLSSAVNLRLPHPSRDVNMEH